MTKPTLFATLQFGDADAGIAFLTALGFTEVSLFRDPDTPSSVAHGEFAWGDAGGLMIGSAREPSDPLGKPEGSGSCYLVVATDAEVDASHDRALAAGATTIKAPEQQSYGGSSCTVADAEGNLYSIGSYGGSQT